jgi:DNA-binding MarR family transcriptional regulator
MERDGLITRAPDQKDRRRSLVTLIPHARALQSVLVAAAVEVNTEATGGLSETESAQLLELVERAIGNLTDHLTEMSAPRGSDEEVR